MKRLSIIIVTYKSEKDIYDCIDSIWKNCDIAKDDLEIIIIDNSPESEPMFGKLRKKYSSDIMLIHNTHNGGYGQGNNMGICKATAPIVLIMNPDVRLMEPIFKTAIEEFEKNKELCIYGMKQMLSETVPSTNSFSCTYMMNGYLYTLLTAFGNRFDCYIPKYMHFSGSCFYIRKSMFEDIGLFDESIFMYGEEDDIHYRLRKKGYTQMKYNSQLHYIHLVKDRKPDLAYERKLVEVAIQQNEKKGYPAYKTIKNRIRNAKMILIREYIKIKTGKKDMALYNMLKNHILILKKRI